MGKKQSNILPFTSDTSFYVALFVVVLVCFLLLVPKVASRIFPFKRQMTWSSFLSAVKKDNNINEQKFWEFREFYSPGYFIFNSHGVPQNEIAKVSNKINIPLNPHNITDIFLTFTSPDLYSEEALSKDTHLDGAINLNALDKKTVLFSKQNQLIFEDSNQNVYILFEKSINEMKNANGFFHYSDLDRTILQNKYWIEVTVLRLQ